MDSEPALHVPAAIGRTLPSENVPGSEEVLGVPASLPTKSLILRGPPDKLGKNRCLGKIVMLLDVILCALKVDLRLVGGDDQAG